jgi:YHS domain-containing protein
MFTSPFARGPVIVALSSLWLVVSMRPVAAQASQAPSTAQQHDHQPPATQDTSQPHDHGATGQGAMSHAREGSGTAWLPDTSPMYAIHQVRGGWELMFHGNGFVQFLDDAGDRGHDQFGSINWVMAMANRNVGAGRLGLRGMFSLEPATIRGCGYPDLLASGERCNGEPIHDQQHQHDLFMEIAATYDRPLRGTTRWQVYGGPAAEPALGPVAYPHRLSAMPNLLAPITHHWLDATHITFGVVTGAVYGQRWKAEASAFNGREPDDQRTGFDLAPLDSVSGRVWFLPSANVATQVSVGRLTEAEPGGAGGPGIDVTRVTASVTHHRLIGEGGIWASTGAWGRNAESEHATNAFLLETNLTLNDRNTWYGRFEVVGKTAHDLDISGDEIFTVGKLQGGYTRYLSAWRGIKPGVGVTASAGFVPTALESVYGSRINPGIGVFVTLRPVVMNIMSGRAGTGAPGQPATVPGSHEHPPATTGAPSSTPVPPAAGREPAARPAPAPAPAGDPRLPVIPAERVIDPVCAQTINLVTAPRATHQGKVYYFCSPADRDEFLKDPTAYLKKRGWS